jgi:hypothetical protein
MRSVLPNGLEQPRKECRAYNLELERLWVSNLDCCLAVVFTVQKFEILLM